MDGETITSGRSDRDAAAGAGLDRGRAPGCPVIIHVGLHKTGTTWLRRHLFAPRDGHEIVYSRDWRLLRGNFVIPDVYHYSADRARAEFAGLVAEAEARGQPLVLSDEMLAALPWRSRFVRAVTADRLAEVFPGATVVMTIREQGALIASSYGHYVRGGFSAGLDDFLAQPEGEDARVWTPIIEPAHFDYEQALDLYEARFGTGRVLLAPLEWVTRNTDAFLDRLAAASGVRLDPALRADGAKIVNTADSAIACAVARHVNRLVAQDARWRRGEGGLRPQAVLGLVDRLLPERVKKRANERLRARVRAAIGDRYRASNRRVSERIGIDLEDYGYVV